MGLAAGTGHRGRPGVGPERACGNEPGAVIADLGKDTCPSDRPETGEAAEDSCIRVRDKKFFDGQGQRVEAVAGCVELAKQSNELSAEGSFDAGRLTH